MMRKLHPLVVETKRFLREQALRPEPHFRENHRRDIDSKLLGLMHGPYTNWLVVVSEEWVNQPEPGAYDLAALRVCLPDILSQLGTSLGFRERTSILASLHKYGCWEICLATEDGAYTLACALVHYVDAYSDSDRLDRAAGSSICALLNAWLSPAEPWRTLPGVITLCQHMFGTPWCVLALPDDCIDVVGGADPRMPGSTYYVDDLVLAARPPFLPGLCRFPIEAPSDPLPEFCG